MITVYRVKISKSQFQKLSNEDRYALILLGYASNQLSVLHKITRFSLNNDAPEVTEQSVSAAQSHILLRLLLGTIFEVWDKFHLTFCGKPIYEKYAPYLSEAGKKGFDNLHSLFGGSKLLVKIRNNISFHLPNEKVIEKAFESTSEDEPWEWYLSHSITNSFYFSSDVVVSHSLLAITGAADLDTAYKTVMAEVGIAMNSLNDFMMAMTQAITNRNFPEIVLHSPEIAVEIAGAPQFSEFILPFYAE